MFTSIRRMHRRLGIALIASMFTALVAPVGLPATPAEAGVIQPRTDRPAAVERLYIAYFDRVPDAAGIFYWNAQAASGRPLAQISEQFARSPEFVAAYGSLDDAAFVRLVYRNVLGREPDAAGLAYWKAELNSGAVRRGEVMLGFSDSPEFKAAVGHLDPGEIDRLYRAFFRREALAEGRNHWLGERARGMSLDTIAAAFAASPEFVDTYGSLDAVAFVQLVYRNVLGRSPDAGGSAYWTEQLSTGRRSRGQVMVGFSESVEFGAPAVHPTHDLGSCELFPADSFWHRRIDDQPVHPKSAQYVATVGATKGVHPDFGSGFWQGRRIGFPWTVVDGSEIPDVNVNFQYGSESDPSPYSVRWDAPMEANSDRHVLTVDRETCTLEELFRVHWQADGSIEAGSGARYDLRSNDLRPETWTSADAAGLAMLPGLVRYEEVAAGRIDHAIRFAVADVGPGYVWPARHESAANRTNPNGPPYGTRFRLRDSVDPSQFTGQARIIVEAMKTYGIIVADIGASWYLSGSPDERWDNLDLRQLKGLQGSDFEAVDTSGLMIEPNSGRSR